MDGTTSNRSNESLVSPNKPLWQLKLTAYAIIFSISLLGNTLVVVVNTILRDNNTVQKRTKAASNYFLVNMAVADLVVTVFSIPVELLTAVTGPKWLVPGIFGLVLCKSYNFCWFQAVNVSTGSLSAIAVDRFLLMFHPHEKIITPRAAKVIIISIWLTTVAFTSPLFKVYQIKVENSTKICYPEFNSLPSIEVYIIFNFVAFVVTPLVVMAILYTAMGVKLCFKEPSVSQTRQSSRRDEKINRRVTVMLCVIVLTFSVCWFPFWVATIYCYTTKSASVCHGYRLNFVAKLLGLSNSALNPCIYFSCSESFRHGVKKMWQRCYSSMPCTGVRVSPTIM